MRNLIIALSMAATTLLSAVEELPSLSVRGYAVLSQPADQLNISLGVVSQGKNAKEALLKNNTQMNQLIKALENSGLGENDYQTGDFSINPLYSPRPRDAASDWSPEIIGFEVRNSLDVTTDQIDKAGTFIDAAASAGANSINHIQFQISDPQKHRDALIRAATKNAIEDAKSLSQAADVQLIKITAISIDSSQIGAPRQFMMKAMAAENTPIAAGDVEMSAGVTIVYQID